jgi:hypothetical protein
MVLSDAFMKAPPMWVGAIEFQAKQHWAGFLGFTSLLKAAGEPLEHSATAVEAIRGYFSEGGAPSPEDLTVAFPNGHRPPVSLPVGCVASRMGDPVLLRALLDVLPPQELLRTVLQDIADDHAVGVETLTRACADTARGAGVDARGYAVACAVDAGSHRCLASVLRWAHAAGSLAVLCNDPAFFRDDVWHLAVLDKVIRVAVAQAAEGAETAAATLQVLLHTPLLPALPLSANQKFRLLEFLFELCHESSLNSFLHRFPDLTKKIDTMSFPAGSLADSLRRRCIYRLMFEPVDAR